MDIDRPDIARGNRIRRALYWTGALIVIAMVTVGVSRLEPAAPTVERATVWTDVVRQGGFTRQVRGTGTLVPEEIRWITPTTEGIVERILVLPGAEVTPNTVLVELSNPELELRAIEAAFQLAAAEAELSNLRVQLQSQLLTQQAQAASVEADFRQAQLQAEADAELASQGLQADLILKQSQSRAQDLANRHEIEEQRLTIATESNTAQIAAKQAEVDRLRTISELRQDQVAELRVRAGIAGVLQQMPLEEGQRVTPGDNLARVGNPIRLKAELRIAETQARDIQIGQPASIDTRNGIIPGHVARIDPAVQEGTVTVDVTLDGPLPRGALPDLTVDGTIELERLENIRYVGLPVFGQENSVVSLFKLVDEGNFAVRARVGLGRRSVTAIEVLEGLQPGDEVILSDMSAWDTVDRVRLN